MTPTRLTPTLTAVTLRRRTLANRLDEAGLPRRFISFDELSAALNAPNDPALLLDTVGLPPPQFLMVLQLIRRANIPAIALVERHDRGTQRLSPFCPLVRVLVADCADLAELGPWVRQLPYEDRRYIVERKPFVIGLPEVEPLQLRTDLTRLLSVLYTAPSMEVAADRSGFSRVTLQRELRAVRAVFSLPSGATTRYTPPAMADVIYRALHAAE